jgi:hypothetical protein
MNTYESDEECLRVEVTAAGMRVVRVLKGGISMYTEANDTRTSEGNTVARVVARRFGSNA